ncbi:MAG: polyphenol oxidase family protein [Proteobacteria bacterium]|nr:polyphenol oxidase family protein [Pseudomonadota bacterium]
MLTADKGLGAAGRGPGFSWGFGGRETGLPSGLLTARQVHGRRVVELPAAPAGTARAPGGHAIEADGLVSRGGSIVAVRTADCVPLLMLADVAGEAGNEATAGVDRRPWAAAVHAGWRGSLAGIVDAAVEHALASGYRASSLRVVLGPSVGPCCYEVSAELVERFSSAGMATTTTAVGQPAIDLRAINTARLVAMGVRASRIESTGPCTCCHAEGYYSVRADRAEQGRQLSWIGWAEG